MARREDDKADSAIPEADRLEQAHEVLADTDEEYSPTSE
jgi:hypothetical protein